MKKIIFFLFLPVIISFYSCQKDQPDKKPLKEPKQIPVKIKDIDKIKEARKLTALTGYNATSYFIYRGQPMGYEYELLNKLCEHLGVKLELVIVSNIDSMITNLREGHGDILAYNLTVTKQRRSQIAFTHHLYQIHQVLVQRKPTNWRKLKLHQIEEKLIRTPIDLINNEIHIRAGSAYYQRLLNLSDEIGEDLLITQVPGDINTDDLIRQVSEGQIDFTVADNNIAQINKSYFDNIDIETKLSLPQRISWAIRKESNDLLSEVNLWLKKFNGSTEYNVLYNKYYKNRKIFRSRIESDYSTFSGTSISKYDPLIKKYSSKINWDWRLLAAQIYQESQFNSKSESWAGARGLMQVLPSTGKSHGVTNLYSPEESMKAGTRHLTWLNNYWRQIPDSLERLKFILGSYNCGQGHVEDARKLTELYGKNPDVWDENVAEYIKLKAKKEYYTKSVVKYGYCRGEEPYNYVQDILERFNIYCQFFSRN